MKRDFDVSLAGLYSRVEATVDALLKTDDFKALEGRAVSQEVLDAYAEMYTDRVSLLSKQDPATICPALLQDIATLDGELLHVNVAQVLAGIQISLAVMQPGVVR